MEGDYEKACDLQTLEGQADAVRSAGLHGSSASDCASATEEFWDGTPVPPISEVEDDIMNASQVDFFTDGGDLAHIASTENSTTYWYGYLRLVDDHWKVTSGGDANGGLPE